MQESVTYQAILRKGRQEGRQEGEAAVILRLLSRRLGAVDPQRQAQIQGLSIPQLEALAEALLDFSTVADLVTWLDEHSL